MFQFTGIAGRQRWFGRYLRHFLRRRELAELLGNHIVEQRCPVELFWKPLFEYEFVEWQELVKLGFLGRHNVFKLKLLRGCNLVKLELLEWGELFQLDLFFLEQQLLEQRHRQLFVPRVN